ncbi:MAG: flagellar export chaperone FliS [Magnetococcales bacterium]|nr:flagellar export chaperone FliS [Magnetococcales bacterium]
MSYALRSYKSSRTATASKEDLLILLYEGAIRFLERSMAAHEKKDLGEHKELLRRGIAIIAELQNTLDFKKGGDLAIQLYELYGFMLTYLTQANLKQDMSCIARVVTQMKTLLEGWRVAVKQVKQQKMVAPPVPQPVAAGGATVGTRLSVKSI